MEKQHYISEFVDDEGILVRVEESLQDRVLATLYVKPSFVSVSTFMNAFGGYLDVLFEDNCDFALDIATSMKTLVDRKVKMNKMNLVREVSKKVENFDWGYILDDLREDSFVKKEEYFLAVKALVGNAIMNMMSRASNDICIDERLTDPFRAVGLSKSVGAWYDSIKALEQALEKYCGEEKSFTKELSQMFHDELTFYETSF